MWASDAFGVLSATGRVPYADGAEDLILNELLEAVDRSDGSDELAARVRDWPTLYHFSPKRSNLLRPLGIKPGMRVLEVGCGMGAITRWLGERNTQVLAIEGNVTRARAAAVRCEGLPNVEVVAGTLDDIPSGAAFDVIVVVGVLEYATVFLDAEDGPRQFLGTLRLHLADGGVLVLAIENQLGLKYLLGYAEDHLALPWVGVEGYARTAGPRTWSRKALGDLLRGTGLPAQRWLYPFPDYKLPSVIIDESLYRRPGGVTSIDQLVRSPVSAEAGPPHLLCDARLAHRQLLTAGLGPDVANSFLVVAGREAEDVSAIVKSDLAWLFGDARRRQWRRRRVIADTGGGLQVADRSDTSEARSLGWLTQSNEAGLERPLVTGDPLDILILEAIRKRDLADVSKLLVMWRTELETHAQPVETADPSHPFAPRPGAMALPEDYLDVLPSNFILNDGTLAFIDREWLAPTPVCAELVGVRALWYLARELVEVGEPHPWGSLATVDEICLALCTLAGLRVTTDTLPRLRRAEAELQHLVSGADVEMLAESLEAMARRRTVDVSPRALPFTALRASVDAARRETEASQARIIELEEEIRGLAALRNEADAAKELRLMVDELDGRAASAERSLSLSQAEISTLQGQLIETQSNAAALGDEVSRLTREVEAWQNRMANIERRFPVRLYRLAKRLARPS